MSNFRGQSSTVGPVGSWSASHSCPRDTFRASAGCGHARRSMCLGSTVAGASKLAARPFCLSRISFSLWSQWSVLSFVISVPYGYANKRCVKSCPHSFGGASWATHLGGWTMFELPFCSLLLSTLPSACIAYWLPTQLRAKLLTPFWCAFSLRMWAHRKLVFLFLYKIQTVVQYGGISKKAKIELSIRLRNGPVTL